MAEGHTVTGFFYNPNIHPEDEYNRRLKTVRGVSEKTGFDLREGSYDENEWRRLISGFEDEPEGARRCGICFSMRLEKTYEYFLQGDFDLFTTTLTVSPIKNAVLINGIGMELGGEKFMVSDFKKKDGFKKTIALAKQWELYRQDYCGCEYSIRGES